MQLLKKTPLRIFGYGALTALLLIAAALLFMNQRQCKPDYNQAQVDSSECIIGANIGFGLLILLAIGVFISATIWAIVAAILSRPKKP